mmetsp:Transcript_8352/g.18726  ORF Transcript_8352/g.18726 Transcript_8352/m.18726 type:complete len:280 (-) Transcript_8352:23-862(-)
MLLFQSLDQVEIRGGDVTIVHLDVLEVFLILLHDPLDVLILRLLDLPDVSSPCLLHVVTDGLHSQLILLLHVPRLSIKLLPQLQDLLVLLQLQHADEVILRNLDLLHLHLESPLVPLDLSLRCPVVVFLQLEGELGIGFQLDDFILLVVSQVLQPLLKHLQLDLLPLFQILVLALLVPKICLLLCESLLLHNPEVVDLLTLHEEVVEVFLLTLAALPQVSRLDLHLLLLLLLELFLPLMLQLSRVLGLALLSFLAHGFGAARFSTPLRRSPPAPNKHRG